MNQENNQSKNNIFLPLSIIIAGFLIGGLSAGAIVYSARTSNNLASSLLGNAGGAIAPEVVTVESRTSNFSVMDVDAEDAIRGSFSAKVKLIDYSDLECPFCKRHHSTLKNISNNLPDESFAWVYRHLPLSFHLKAMPEAIASECVALQAGQDGFWNFIGGIYEVTPSGDGLDLAILPDLARESGVTDIARFNACLENEETREHVEREMRDGGNNGTPYGVIVSAEQLDMPTKGAILEEALNRNLERLVTFSDDDSLVSVSGAVPQDFLETVIGILIDYNEANKG